MNATQEQWRPVVGYEGLYEVSSHGRVRSLDRIVPYKDGRKRFAQGQHLRQSRGGTARRPLVALGFGTHHKHEVHVLVAAAFLGPRPTGMQICHNDGNPANNTVENLRYDTPSENMQDSLRHGTHFQASKTHCPQGHEYTPANTRYSVTPGGFNKRTCRICKREQTRRSRANGATW